MSHADPYYPDLTAAFEAYARHVSPGKVGLLRSLGVEFVMGEREGIWFGDAFSDRRWINCHSNGGVFNLGHRHPAVLWADAVKNPKRVVARLHGEPGGRDARTLVAKAR